VGIQARPGEGVLLEGVAWPVLKALTKHSSVRRRALGVLDDFADLDALDCDRISRWRVLSELLRRRLRCFFGFEDER
jgi:hypothetical protein